MSEEVPPEGVRLVLDDGTEIPCEMVRAIHLDRTGVTYYLARPSKPVDPARTYVVAYDKLHPHTGFRIDADFAAHEGLTGAIAPPDQG